MIRPTRLLLPLIFTIVPTFASAQLVSVVPTMYESAFEDSEKDYYAPQSCDTSCCDVIQECCCCPCPSWSASVDYVHMWRKGPDATALLLAFPARPARVPVFTANELDFHGQSGVDAVLAYDSGCGHGAEIRYFWIDEFSDDQNPNLPLLVSPATQPFTDLAVDARDLWNVRYESAIQSIELLGRSSSEHFNVSYGFRYLNLTETLTFGVPSVPVFDPIWLFRTQNNLYGFQLGIDGEMWRTSRFSLDYFSKAGIYYNDVSVSSQSPLSPAAGGASQGVAAFVAESGLSGSYQICRNLLLTAGYRFLFLDGVSLAADQVPNTGNMLIDPIAMNIDKNSLYYHGFNVGLELRR